MNESQINLNKRQIEFIIFMTEIRDPMEAIKAFAKLMIEEKINPSQMGEYVDKIIERMRKKKAK